MTNKRNIGIAKRLNLLNEFIHGVNQCKTKQDIYGYIGLHLPDLIPADRVTVSILGDARKNLTRYALCGQKSPSNMGRPPAGQKLKVNETIANFALVKRGTIVANYPNSKCSNCTAFADCTAINKFGITAAMITPIYINGRAIGTINVASKTKNIYSSNMRKIFETIALLVSASLEKLHFIKEIGSSQNRINTHADRLQMLMDISVHLAHTKSEESLLQTVFDFFTGDLSAQRSSYVVVDKKHQKFILSYGCTDGKFSAPKIEFPMSESILTSAMSTGEPQLNIISGDKKTAEIRKKETHYTWSIPIFENDEVSRLLNLSTEVEPKYKDDLVGIFTILSTLISTALENITSHELIFYRAHYDLLTGAHNRHSFQEKMNNLIHGKTAKPFTLLIIDLDDFKQLNDFHGHLFGDKVLTKVVKHFQTIFGEESFIARLGGDEFAVIGDFSKYKSSMLNGMKLNTMKLENDGRIVPVGFSAGIAHFPRHAQSKSRLMKYADMALYKAKTSTSNIKVFKSKMAEQFNQKFQILNDFKTALEKEEIIPFYQPIIDLKTQKLHALEALARWDHKKRGILSPADFSHVFEVPELSGKIAYVMHRHICKDMARWKTNGIDFHQVALNVEAVNLMDPAFPLNLLSKLHKNGLEPSDYAIEITENFILNSRNEYVLETLKSLRLAGMSIVLDDFGTGYSSISHLKELPITTVKLDKTYVTGSLNNKKDYHIARSIISLAKELNIKTVAEGIETEKIKNLFVDLTCDYGQGFLFAQPLPAQEVPEFIDKLNNKKLEVIAA